MLIVFAVSTIHIFTILSIGIAGRTTILSTPPIMDLPGHYHLVGDGVIQVTDGDTLATDGVTQVMVGAAILPIMVEVVIIRRTIQAIHRTPVMEEVITPTDKDDRPIRMLAEVVEVEVQQELQHRIREAMAGQIQE